MQEDHEVTHERGVGEDPEPHGCRQLNKRWLIDFRKFTGRLAVLFGLRWSPCCRKNRAAFCKKKKKKIITLVKHKENYRRNDEITKAHSKLSSGAGQRRTCNIKSVPGKSFAVPIFIVIKIGTCKIASMKKRLSIQTRRLS